MHLTCSVIDKKNGSYIASIIAPGINIVKALTECTGKLPK